VRLKSSALDRACRGPERARIDPIRIEREHLVVEPARRRRRLGEPVESADILPGLVDDPGAVVVPRSLMAGDHRAWVERLDGVERRDPLAAGVRVGLAEVEVNVVVGDIPGDHQADGRDVQTRRVIGVCMPDFHHDQVAPFELDHLALELLGDHEPVRDLARKQRAPEVRDVRWRGLLLHEFHHRGRGDRTGIGETLQERSDAKEMVAVAVGDIDRGQVFAVCFDPLYQGVRLLDGHQRVDEDGVPLAGDEGRRYRRPQPLLRAWRQVAGDNGYARRYKHVPAQRNVSRFDVSHMIVSFVGS
jgi:hypothetical protein